MALGKNIKKKELIPSKKKADRKSTIPERQSAPMKVPSEPAVQSPVNQVKAVVQGPGVKKISKEEFEKRKSLQIKFEHEISTLSGKIVQLIVFKIGEEQYALDINKTREVVVTPPISKVPHVPAYIKGVTNIRGSVILVFDLAEKYNFRANEEKDRSTYTLVIESDQYNVGILLDDVPLTLKVSGDDISTSSGIIADTAMNETYIKGVIKREGEMIFFVDIDELIEGDKLSVIQEALA